jgi:hypothetical protein
LDTHPDAAAVNEILSYFVRNPQAADNLEGIARWRLLHEFVTRKVDETQRALTWLVAKGYLRGTSTAGTGLIYTLNPDKAEEACELIAASKTGVPGGKA